MTLAPTKQLILQTSVFDLVNSVEVMYFINFGPTVNQYIGCTLTILCQYCILSWVIIGKNICTMIVFGKLNVIVIVSKSWPNVGPRLSEILFQQWNKTSVQYCANVSDISHSHCLRLGQECGTMIVILDFFTKKQLLCQYLFQSSPNFGYNIGTMFRQCVGWILGQHFSQYC